MASEGRGIDRRAVLIRCFRASMAEVLGKGGEENSLEEWNFYRLQRTKSLSGGGKFEQDRDNPSTYHHSLGRT